MLYYRFTIIVYFFKLVKYCYFFFDIIKHEHQLFFIIRYVNNHKNKKLSIYQLTSLRISQLFWTIFFFVKSDFQNSFQDYVIRFLKFKINEIQKIYKFVTPLRNFFSQIKTRFKNLLAQCLFELKTSDMFYWIINQSSVNLVMNAENFTIEIEIKNEISGLNHITEKNSHAKSQQKSDVEKFNKNKTNQTISINFEFISNLESVNYSWFAP